MEEYRAWKEGVVFGTEVAIFEKDGQGRLNEVTAL